MTEPTCDLCGAPRMLANLKLSIEPLDPNSPRFNVGPLTVGLYCALCAGIITAVYLRNAKAIKEYGLTGPIEMTTEEIAAALVQPRLAR
jgi:hypothetical protein